VSPDWEIDVPAGVRAGVWANDVEIFGDVEEATLDFVRVDPRDENRATVVARVTVSRWCILRIKAELERFA
jgi:hypothetical protein